MNHIDPVVDFGERNIVEIVGKLYFVRMTVIERHANQHSDQKTDKMIDVRPHNRRCLVQC